MILEQAVEDLKYNFPIYFSHLLEKFISAEKYLDLGHYLYTYQDRCGEKKILGLPERKHLTFNTLCIRMRNRKYAWEDSKQNRELLRSESVKKDSDLLKKEIQIFIKRINKNNPHGIRIGSTVKNLSKLFKFNENQEKIIQFLIDCELAVEIGILQEDYASLFSWSITKEFFRSSIYEILSTFAAPVDKAFKEFDGIIRTSKNSPFRHVSYTSEHTIEPFWPSLPQIYLDLIYENKEITFANVKDKFKNEFKTKLEYEDFKDHENRSLIEKLVETSFEKKSMGTNLLFYGLPGTGKTEMVYALAKQNGWTIIAIGEHDEISPLERIDCLVFAQKFFGNFREEKIIFLFDEMEDLLRIEQKDIGKNKLNRLIENTPFPIFWTSNNVWRFDQSFLRRMTYAKKFDIPKKKRRKEIWDKFTKDNNLDLDSRTIEKFAQDYQTSPSVIGNVAEVAMKANLKEEETKLVIEDLLTAFNFGDEPKITKNSYSNEEKYDFDIANADTNLESIVKKLKNSKMNNWSMCLNGPPGTGKSALAKHIAKEIGMKVIYKKASDLKSMWVGETEKNIAAAFREAKDDEALLIFDEADSLLHSRVGASRSWEVSEVNEMLTQMEYAEFPFICTTNLMENLDEASLRRFIFKIKFDWLSNEQLNLACSRIFNLEMRLPKEWRLSPGDLVSVKKRLDILNETNEAEVFKLLKQEVETKNLPGTRKIGF